MILEVIEKYRGHECLWKITSEDIHNQNKRNAPLEDILLFFKSKDPSENKETSKKKIETTFSTILLALVLGR